MMSKNIYGRLPVELIAAPHDAVQFSPLMPGAQALEECGAGSLHDMAMHAPAGTLERRYVLALALRALVPNAHLTVMAAKDKGGTRLKKELENFGCAVSEDARRHFRICECIRPENPAGLDQALAEGAPRFIENIDLWSQPGVFSWDRLDPGSVLLVEHLPALSGRGADLGCGIGYLSREVLKSSTVQSLTLIDIDRRAIACAKQNITDPRASFLWADIHSPAELADLDFVIMNPPFHDTGIENQELGVAFITRAHDLLRVGGACWLTANRHLPYEEALRRLFKTVTLKAEADGFKIYQAIK